MERYNAHEDDSLFAQEEQQRYFDTLTLVVSKIEHAEILFAKTLGAADVNRSIPANLMQPFLLWPIEEIETLVKKIEIGPNNMHAALALSEALEKKIDNLRG